MEYLNKLIIFLEKNKNVSIPTSLEDIANQEQKIGKSFPKAYKEFLTLAGNYFIPIHNSTTGLSGRFKFLNEINERAKLNLKHFNLENLVTEDFWVVAEGNSSLFINYFYFNGNENPQIYALDMEGYSESNNPEDYYGIEAESFSDYIDDFIDLYDPKLDK